MVLQLNNAMQPLTPIQIQTAIKNICASANFVVQDAQKLIACTDNNYINSIKTMLAWVQHSSTNIATGIANLTKNAHAVTHS
jgi:hypothetical protein